MPPAAHAARHLAVALFLAFLGFYLLTASGHLYAVDEETLFRVTEGLVERRSVALPDNAWGMVGNRATPNSPLYAQYTPGQPLAALPLYLIGRLLATRFPAADAGYVLRFCVALLGAFVTAATVALLYNLARQLGYGVRAALALAATYGLATGAWPHGRTFFAEPLTALGLLAAFYALRVGTATGRDGWLVGAGLATIAACIVKPHAAIAVPILAIYLLARIAFAPEHRRSVLRFSIGSGVVVGLYPLPRTGSTHRSGSGRRRSGGEGSPLGHNPTTNPETVHLDRHPLPLAALSRACLAWGSGLFLGALPFAWYNAHLYGNPLRTGYVAVGGLFTTPFLTGLYGLTLSSGKGLLWYSPPILLALVGWWAFCRQHRAEALACLGVGLVHLAFYSRINFWHGDGSWGPRYLTIALPFLLLPALGLFAARPTRPLHAVAATLIGAVVALGVAVQLLGVLVNFDWYLQRSDERERHFTPAASPILAHARILRARAAEWHARRFPPADTVFLRAGFSYPEAQGNPQALFPRWTTGAATIALVPANHDPLLVKLTFFDHRPAAQRTSQSIVLVNGVPLDAKVIERNNFTGDGQGWTYQFAIPPTATGNPILVTLQSPTWNPKASGQGERDEDIGVFVHNVEVWRAGQPLRLREALVFPPLPDTPRQRFWWFNDDATRHHPLDWWATYLLAAGLPRGTTLGWLAAYGSIGLATLALGLTLGARALPARTTRPPTRRPRKRPKSRRPTRTATKATSPNTG